MENVCKPNVRRMAGGAGMWSRVGVVLGMKLVIADILKSVVKCRKVV